MLRENRAVRALGAFSGGLDGMIASRLLMEQGIGVELVTFTSPFFDSREAERASRELSVPWRTLDFTDDIFRLLKDPPSGFGKNMNPCIDCHAAMFARLRGLCAEENYDFIFSGEVMGQRPMSQNRGSLNRVKNLSEAGEVLLRPLSAKLMPPTPMELSGIVDREKLLGLSGRGRTSQIKLAESYGFSFIPAPAGGCLLTDPGYSKRLGVLMNMGLLTKENATMIRYGRMFALDRAIALAGRTRHENQAIGSSGHRDLLDIKDIPSPLGVLLGNRTPGNIRLLASIVASFTKAEGRLIAVTGPEEFETEKMPIEERERLRIVL